MSETTQHCWLRKIRGEEWEALQHLAEDDQHEVIAASHVFIKDREIVGYASMAQVPLILPWFSTKRCGPRDSLYFVNACENLVAECMAPHQELIAVPFVPGSPFEPHMEKLGFVNAGKVNLTFKKVK